jgi:hypothetical protein
MVMTGPASAFFVDRPLEPAASMLDDGGRLTALAVLARDLAMRLADKKPSTEVDKIPTFLSERLRSWFEKEARILVSWSHNHRRSIALLCASISYLISWVAIILLASYASYRPCGYDGFYYIAKVEFQAIDTRGDPMVIHRKEILPSFKFWEMLVAGSAASVIGLSVPQSSRHRFEIACFGAIPMMIAWFGLAAYYCYWS